MKSSPLFIAEYIRSIYSHMNHELRDHFGETDFTIPQVYLMQALHRKGPMKLVALSDEISQVKSTTSGIVDRLERQGYVIRERNPNDRRSVLIGLTAQGKDAVEGFRDIIHDYFQDIFSGSTPEELERIEESLRQLHKIIGANTPDTHIPHQ